MLRRALPVAAMWALLVAGLPRTERRVYFAKEVRDQLAQAWDDSVYATQSERGYCLSVRPVETFDGDSADVVVSASRAVPIYDRPSAILFRCGKGHHEPMLHTHPPTTCGHDANGQDTLPCSFGGDEAWICEPSDNDRLALRQTGDAWAAIQCDKNDIIVYYAGEP